MRRVTNKCKLPVADALFLADSLSFFVVIFHFQNQKLNKTMANIPQNTGQR